MGMREHLMFLGQARREFHHTGAILPSSSALARALARTLPKARPLRVLEVGGGTGALTRELLEHLSPECRLDVVEINARFADWIEENVLARRENVPSRMVRGDFLEVSLDQEYDAVISGLPLNNFDPVVVRKILDRAVELLAPGGVFSWYEYLWIRVFRGIFLPAEARARTRKVDQELRSVTLRGAHSRRIVLLNFPPAVVHMLTPDPAGAGLRE